MFYNQQTLVSRFTPKDVLYESLLDILGGKHILELMINARDFRPMYARQQGLVFHFNVSYDCDPRVAKFYVLATYQVRLVVEKMFGDNTYGIEKPYHCVTVSKPTNLVHVFETITGTTLSFS